MGLGCGQPCMGATQVGDGLGGGGCAVHDTIQRSDHQPAASALCSELCQGLDHRASGARCDAQRGLDSMTAVMRISDMMHMAVSTTHWE